MKNLVSLSILGITLGVSALGLAQNIKVAPTSPKIKFPRVTPTPYKGKIPHVTPTPIKGKGEPAGPRIGERFQLRVWASVLPGMPTRNWCGTLKLDDQIRWSIPPSEATNYQLGPGSTLEISEDSAHRQGGTFTFSSLYGNPRKVKVGFDLYSVQSAQSSLRAAYRDQIDLLRESGKIYKCTMGKGEAALFVKVESIGYVYGIRLPHPLPTPTPRYRPPGPHRRS